MATDLQAPPVNPLAVVFSDPDRLASIDVEKLKELAKLHHDFEDRAAKRRFDEAFHALQTDMAPVRKQGWNDQTKSWYARLEDIDRMLDPLMVKHGFTVSLSSRTSEKPDHTVFLLMVRNSGHSETHELEAPHDYTGIKGTPNKTRMHGMGSSYNYAGRYLKTNVFNVQTFRDDDGNAGGGIGPGAGCISVDQVIELNDLINETGSNRALFLKACRVSKLEELPLSMYAGAKARLEMKRATS